MLFLFRCVKQCPAFFAEVCFALEISYQHVTAKMFISLKKQLNVYLTFMCDCKNVEAENGDFIFMCNWRDFFH